MNGVPRATLRVAPAGSAPNANAPKVDPNDPQVRKLVYNAYREMLSKKHTDANVIVDSAPQEFVTQDQGVGSRVESMMRQQSELKGGNMNAGGPPPPPPPPPIPGIIPTSRLPSEIPARPAMNNPPSALASAMMKDRKPFTYTPGGLDLSEIRSPRMQRRLYRNAQSEGVKLSPLAQQPLQGQPNAAASPQCAPLGLPIQVLPMPGVGMGPQHQSQPKEAPKPKKTMCGPAPPPPPFLVNAENSFTMPVSSPISSVPSTISSPPISSSPTSPAAPQPMLAKEPGPSIPMAPPLPTQNFAARRGSLFSASPPTSPLVSTIPCEPSPPPLPPPQAVRVPVTPPVVQESSSPSQPILPKEREIPSPPVLMSMPETIHLQKTAGIPEMTPGSLVENNLDLPISAESAYLPKSTSTPIQDIILGYPDTDEAKPPASILSSSQEIPQELIAMSEEVSCENEFPIAEDSLDKTSPQKENLLSSDSQSSFTESSPILDEVYEPIPEIQPSKRIESPSISHESSPYYLEEHIPITPLATKSSPAEELAPLRQMPSKEPTPFSRETTPNKQVGVKELTPVKQAHIKDSTPVKQSPVKEPTPEKIAPVKELTPVKFVPVMEPTPFKPAPVKEPTPEKPVFDKELTPIKNVPIKEHTPVRQVSIIEPAPVQLVPIKEFTAVQQVPIEEFNPVQQVTVKESTPVRQVPFEKPSVIKQAPIREQPLAGKSELNDLSAMKQVPARQAGVAEPFDNDVPVIFSPLPVKEMPLKEPTPVRQISQEPTPVRQAILEQPVFKDATPMFSLSGKPNAPSRPTPTQPVTGFGNSVLRQVPAQVAGLKRQSSLPEPPFVPNIPLEPPPFITQVSDMQFNQSSVPKTNLSKQNSLSQPLPIKPIPIRTNNEMDVNRARVRAKSPPPPSTSTTAVHSASAGAKGTHVVCQPSPPTKPSSQVSPPNKNLGASNDVPPHAEEEISSPGPLSPSGERSPRRSPTTGLHRAPLPWMCGHLREPSPPPLFVQRAQQTVNRFQPNNRFIRQSSLGPEGPTESFARAGTMTHQNTRQPTVFQRQQSLPPPQKPQQQQQSQALPVRIQQQYKPQQPQIQNQPHLVQTQQPPLQPQPQLQFQPRPVQTQPPPLQPQPQVQFQPRPVQTQPPPLHPQPQVQFQPRPVQTQPPPLQPQPQVQFQPRPVQTQPPPLQPQPQLQFQPRPIQTQQPKLQPQTQVRQPHTFESQIQQPHSNHIQSQPKSHPIRIQHQGYLNQQPRVIPVQVQQSQQPKQKPKERIIPIMIESDSPPREIPPASNHTASSTTLNTNAAANERFIPIRMEGNAATNNAQNAFQQPLPYINQQQQQQNPRPSWNSSSGTSFKNPINTLSGSGQSGAFLPYNSLSSSSSENSSNINNNNNNNNSNPLDALHQMQQSLAQLNSGLENAFPRFIQKKMSDTITPRTTPSNQCPNGDQADMGPPVQSRSFRVLQNVLDHQDNTEPQGPIHIPSMKHAQQPGQYQPPQPQQFQQQHVFQQQPGVNNEAATTEQAVPEPKKYMGGNIPSRSFRMLQAMTGSDDAPGPGQSDL